MNRLYDNGSVLLGTKRDVIEYARGLMTKLDYTKDMEELIEELESNDLYKEDTILAINYEYGMGIMIENYWDNRDKIELGEE